MVKCLKAISVIAIITILILFLLWYSLSFFHYKSEVDRILLTSYKEYKVTDGSLYKLSVIAAGGEERILTWASQRAYWDISWEKSKESKIVSQFNSLLWRFCFQIHYSKKDIFLLWCHYSIYMDGYGLNNASNKIYGKNIQDLSIMQKATIITMLDGPAIYTPGSEQSKVRVKQILAEYYK